MQDSDLKIKLTSLYYRRKNMRIKVSFKQFH